ncbi:lactate utilization protein [uncultured Sphaerochaeta sp.]|uniref:lactate utilization protein n=1 Tax=uncultured Sphaerochaeta sp. TaxID=886478 RepID=UPI002A0A5301|nr:lactate utilization protein [uncultured Sphaerochaeta sp.]
MDAHIRKNREQQVARTIKALQQNNIMATFVPSSDKVPSMVASLLAKGEAVAVGGSVSLKETGVLDLLRNGTYDFHDRYAKGLTSEQIREVFLDSFRVDTYFASANALTEHGEIYCVDGTSNRTAAMLYGPKQVILITSWDKIVPDLASAIVRVKTTAAPANAIRLGVDSFCNKNGKCLSPTCTTNNLMAVGAGICEHTICSNYVVFSHQMIKDRIKVLIVGESIGY